MERRRRWGIVLAALIASFGTNARAETDPEQLFKEGAALMEQQKFDEALPKLLEAQRVDPGIGTQFNIAVCYEKLGKLGTAWRNYTQVAQLAGASGKKQREAAAREKLGALQNLAPALVVLSHETGDVTVKVDGATLTKEDWAFYPVDPGQHRVEAIAPAKKPWSTATSTPPNGQRLQIVIPPLETATTTKVVTLTKETTSFKRTLGFIVGGVGVAGLVAAGVSGIMVLDAKSTADDDCTIPVLGSDRKRCGPEGDDAVNRGRTLLPINAIAWGVGVVGIGVGAFLILTSGKKQEGAKTALVPIVGPSAGGLSWTRRF